VPRAAAQSVRHIMKLFFLAITASLLMTGCSKTAVVQNGELSRSSISEAYNSVRPIKGVEIILNSGEVIYGEDLRTQEDGLSIRGEVAMIIPNGEIREVSIKSRRKPPVYLEPFVGILMLPVVVVFTPLYWSGVMPP